MRKLVRPVAAVTLAAALILAMSGIAGATTISNEKYAKTDLRRRSIGVRQDSIDKLKAPDASDPAAFQTDAVAAVDSTRRQSLNEARDQLKKVSPERRREEGLEALRSTTSRGTSPSSRALRHLRRRPTRRALRSRPTSPSSASSLQNASAKLEDPFSKLTDNQDLLGAFGDEKSCKKIVTVYGRVIVFGAVPGVTGSATGAECVRDRTMWPVRFT